MRDEPLHELSAVLETAGLLRHGHLAATGLSDQDIGRLVRAGSIIRVRRDAYRTPAAEDDRLTDFRTTLRLVLSRPSPPIVGGPAAGLLHGLPLLATPTTIHICVPHTGGHVAGTLTTPIALPPRDQLTAVGSLTAEGPARSVLDTARLESVAAGVIAADAALRRRLTTIDGLRRAVETMRRLHGVGRARLSCEIASPLSESPGESWSAVVMHRHGIPAPQRQQPFTDGSGFVGQVDFWWPNSGVVGEFDGRVKYGRKNPAGRPPEDVLWDEKRREDRLRALDLTVVRWTTSDLHHPAAWITRLHHTL